MGHVGGGRLDPWSGPAVVAAGEESRPATGPEHRVVASVYIRRMYATCSGTTVPVPGAKIEQGEPRARVRQAGAESRASTRT